MSYYVYIIQNTQNEKVYIGCTSRSPEKRFREHINESNRKDTKFHFAKTLKEEGVENFQFITLPKVDTEEQMYFLEKHYIKYTKSQNPKFGYNRSNGGKSNAGFKKSESNRKEQSERVMGDKNPFYGKTHSDKTKEAIGNANRGRIPNDETRKKMSKSNNRIWKNVTGEDHPAFGLKKPKDSVMAGAKKHRLRVPVSAYDKVTGEFVKTFFSRSEAARWLIENKKTKGGSEIRSMTSVIGGAIKNNVPRYGFFWKDERQSTSKSEETRHREDLKPPLEAPSSRDAR